MSEPTNPNEIRMTIRLDLPHLDELEAERDRLERGNAEQPPAEPLLRWFAFKHLPPKLQGVSALRKLLESKDAAVRAAL